MADNILTTDRSSANLDIAAKDVAGVKFPRNILTDPSGNDITPLTDAALRAAPVPVSLTSTTITGSVAVTNAGLTSLDAKTPALGAATSANSRPVVIASDQANVPTVLSALVYPASTNNSSSTQLGAGASFTGVIENIQNLQAAQISVTSDQAYTVQVKQYIDAGGTRLVSTDTFTRAAGVPLNENVTLPGNYFQVVVTNNGGSTTTTFRLDTTFGIMNTQPRALTNEGKFPTEAARPPALLSSYSVAGVIAINTVLLTLDCSVYRSVSVQCTSMGTAGVVTPEWSNDNTNWQTATLLTQAGASATTFNAAGLWVLPVVARYLRLRLSTATTAGTTTLSVHQLDDRTQMWLATQPVSGTVSVTGYPTAAASADALANPTVTQIGAAGLWFNGTSWDRARGMSLGSVTTGDTGAKTATGNGATITNVGNKGVDIVIVLGAVSGTTPTCVFKVQNSVDGGTNWVDVPGAATASLTASGTYGISIYPGIAVTAGSTTSGTKATASQILSRTWRMVWTIGGTTPSFTITSISYTYPPN